MVWIRYILMAYTLGLFSLNIFIRLTCITLKSYFIYTYPGPILCVNIKSTCPKNVHYYFIRGGVFFAWKFSLSVIIYDLPRSPFAIKYNLINFLTKSNIYKLRFYKTPIWLNGFYILKLYFRFDWLITWSLSLKKCTYASFSILKLNNSIDIIIFYITIYTYVWMSGVVLYRYTW